MRDNILTSSEIHGLKSMRKYWQEVRKRENQAPLMDETVSVCQFLGTRVLEIVEYYLDTCEEEEKEGEDG